jgi:ABC-type polysaccharide/polyol phosphate transport system ATPase subunit
MGFKMAFVNVESLSISFPIYDVPHRSLKNAFLRSVGGSLKQGGASYVVVEALSDVSFNLTDGDRLGIIGHNGAGKTTLLRAIAGIYPPTTGCVGTQGSISSLTDVTLGMDADATGYENILLRCVFLGLTFQQANDLQESIAEFTGLGDYLALPIRTYSTGMLVRLGFAISTSIQPEILVMDEMIGAGDADFARKAEARIKSYVSSSKIVVLSSHNLQIVKDLCNKVLYLENGKVVALGNAQDVVSLYLKM